MSKLPTKKELMERLQNACDIINGTDGGDRRYQLAVDGVDSYDGSMCCIFINLENGLYNRVGPIHKFRPENQAPKKGRAVLDSFGIVAWSKGFFDENGYLMTVSSYYSIEGPSCCSKVDWCDLLNPAHHSEGWKKEWNVDLKGGDDE